MADPSPSDKTLDSSSSSTATTPPDQPPQQPLSRNSSFSKLNAKAPEFVPMRSPSPPPSLIAAAAAAADPRLMIVPPPSPPPPSLVHGFPPSPLPMPIPVRAPPPFPPPHIHHPNHHDHHQHHQKQHNNNNQGHNGDNVNNNRHQKQHHHDKKEHHLHQQEGVQNDKDHGSGSSSRSNNNNNNNNNIINNNHNSNNVNINGLSDEATQKLINQVEYYFSDVNLATTEHLIRFIFKDPEGFVPISVVASFKKIKALISSNSQLAAVLRSSTKLVVSEDGKKVKRLHGLTSSDMEELQARIIVAENLPEDHCHQNLMKIFSAVGSVKSIRTCQPQPSNNIASSASRSSKNDNMSYNNKLHAFVEYDSVELAEKAIAELNDEDSWRNGLRVRPLQKQVLKLAQGRTKKAGNESEVNCEEDVSASDLNQNEKQSEDLTGDPDFLSHEQGEEQSVEKEGGQKKSRNRNKGKGRGRGHNHNHHHQTGRGSHSMNNTVNGEQAVVGKQQPPGPRMPDGTRGFSLGRGRPVTVTTA